MSLAMTTTSLEHNSLKHNSLKPTSLKRSLSIMDTDSFGTFDSGFKSVPRAKKLKFSKKSHKSISNAKISRTDAKKASKLSKKSAKLSDNSSETYLKGVVEAFKGPCKGVSEYPLSVVEYETIKDKMEPRMKHFGFSMKANTQYHWLIVAKQNISPLDAKSKKDPNAKTKSFAFSLSMDKFLMAQGKAVSLGDAGPQNDHKAFSYGCTGAKRTATSLRKKMKFLQECLLDSTEEREKRAEFAKAHKKSLKGFKGKTKVFVDMNGKEHPYFGMPIGGKHNWSYQDADFVQHIPSLGRNVVWRASDVKWEELKVNKKRWDLKITGVLTAEVGPNDGQLAKGVSFDEGGQDFLLIADQIATKLSPTSYHVKLKGVQLAAAGATSGQMEETRMEMLQAIVDNIATGKNSAEGVKKGRFSVLRDGEMGGSPVGKKVLEEECDVGIVAAVSDAPEEFNLEKEIENELQKYDSEF